MWRIGKKIKTFEKEEGLPKELYFSVKCRRSFRRKIRNFKKEIYVKDDGHLAELNYLKKKR